MTKPEPTIRVNVDVTNPGQFFACCGLLELADRLGLGAEGWFEDGEFCIICEESLDNILAALVNDIPAELTQLDNGLSVKPLIAPLGLSIGENRNTSITLDAWMRITFEKGKVIAAANPPWNFWSGQQTSLRIWTSLRDAFLKQLKNFDRGNYIDLFNNRILLSGRFGFDPGAAWNALDVGFSPNEQGMQVASSIAVELLAAVGLQRFRPIVKEDRETFLYATWGQPYSPSIAATAAVAAIPGYSTNRFLGRVVSRGSYAALSYSTPLQGDSHE